MLVKTMTRISCRRRSGVKRKEVGEKDSYENDEGLRYWGSWMIETVDEKKRPESGQKIRPQLDE